MGYEWGIHFLSFLHHNSNIVHSILEVLNMNTMQDYKCLFTIYCNLFINDIIQKLYNRNWVYIFKNWFASLGLEFVGFFLKTFFFRGGGHQNSPWSVPTVSILHAFYTVPLLFFIIWILILIRSGRPVVTATFTWRKGFSLCVLRKWRNTISSVD